MILARELALKVLYEIDNNKAYTNIELNKKINSFNILGAEKALATEIVYGVVKWRLTIDYEISQISNIKIHRISPWIINILRIGIYQIKFLDKIPQSAAVNESVKLAKRYGHIASAKFVNGVLRNYIRNNQNIKYPDQNDTINYLSIKYSHPQWMVSNWLNAFGYEFTKSLCEANNETAPICARTNTLKCTVTELKSILKSEGLDVKDGLYFKDTIIIKSPKNITDLESFKNGLFSIQDESSSMVGTILEPKPGQIVVDVCAAPGGKSTHIAQLMDNKGIIYSRDIHEHKIKLVEQSSQRLGIDIIKTKKFDASVLDESLLETADRVLVDAPCTGLGIIRRKPDIKWNRQSQDKNDIISLQKKILDVSSRYVKSGGVLVYSTCTIEEDENIEVINQFLSSHNEFQMVDITNCIPQNIVKDSCKYGHIQIYPNIDKTDGFFIAKMVKNKV